MASVMGSTASSHGCSGSESEYSAPETFPEGSNSPLRSPDTTTPEVGTVGKPFLRLVEPPVESCRFRYRTEMKGTHGPIMGIRYSKKGKQKIYPSVKLCNYKPVKQNEKVIIRCTLTTANENEADRVPHVHQLKGKEKTSKNVDIDDPIDVDVSSPHYHATFESMTILFIKKDHQFNELLEKKKRHLRRKFTNPDEETNEEQLQAEALNEIQGVIANSLNTACLKFEALRESGGRMLYEPICPAIYSRPIKNQKSTQYNDLKICRIDKVAGTCLGKDEVFIFVEKVNKKDIKVRFFELNDNEEVWSSYAEMGENDVHFQYAIAFRTPRYRDVTISDPVKVYFQLERPSDRSQSSPMVFEYTPDSKRWQDMVRKRPRRESPPIPVPVNDFSSPASTIWNSERPSSSGFYPPSPWHPWSATNTVPSLSDSASAMTMDTSDSLAEFLDLFLPDIDNNSMMDTANVDSSTMQHSHSSPSEPLSLNSFPSGDSEKIMQMISNKDALAKYASNNMASEQMVEQFVSELTRWEGDLVEHDGTKVEMAVPVAEHQGPCPNPPVTNLHQLLRGSDSRVQSYNRSKIQLTKENIVSIVDKVVNRLLKLKKIGKIRENDIKRYLLGTFTTCVGNNDDRILHVLASKKNFPPEMMAFLNVLKTYNIVEIVINLKNNQGQTALHVAAEKGSLQTIAQLVELGGDVDCRDNKLNTPVHLVENREGNDAFHAVEHILEKNPDLSIYNEEGLTALHLFVMSRKSDITSSLIMKQEVVEDCSFDIINQPDRKQGNTALHIAVQRRFREIVSLLLNFEHRIDVNFKNFEDKTPLAYVSGETDPVAADIEELLLASNADPSLVPGKKEKLKKLDVKDEVDNDSESSSENEVEEIDNVDDSLPSYALDWKTESELRLLDAKTICSVCPVLDDNKNWEKLLKKMDFDEDIRRFLESKWSPSLYLLKSVAEAFPNITSESLRDMLIRINPECKKAAQYIDDMILFNMGVF